MANDERIWQFLKSYGLNDYGAAGLMGNLYAESGLNPQNLQNTYEKKLGYSDASYTAAVDNGFYSDFVHDSAGYGLAQWTFWSRKQALLNHCKAAGASIADPRWSERRLEAITLKKKEGTPSGVPSLKID